MLLYTLRNLIKSPIRFAQLLFSTFLVFSLILGAMAFEEGLRQSLATSSDDKNVILMGVGSEESLERSEVTHNAISSVLTIRGLKKSFSEKAISPEVHYNSVIKVAEKEVNTLIRGVKKESLLVYPNLVIFEGDFPNSGEVMLGRTSFQRMGVKQSDLGIGSSLIYENKEFIISGFFAAPGSIMESEIWMNLNDIITLTQRDSISSITIRLDTAEFEDIDLFSKQRLDLQLTAIKESDYYKKLGQLYDPILWMVWISAVLIAAGAFFGSMNTFYADIEGRSKELATLQAMGFQRSTLFLSLCGESLVIHFLSFQLSAICALVFFSKLSLSFGSTYFTLSLSQPQLVSTLFLSFILGIIVTIPASVHCLNSPLNTSLKN
jgi:putative ABC transport system permease protein